MSEEQGRAEHWQHSWRDYGQIVGRNVVWCLKCDVLAFAGQEYAVPQAEPVTPSAWLAEHERLIEATRKALNRSFLLGQTYWQQADSDYTSQHRKSDETQQKQRQLADETVAALLAHAAARPQETCNVDEFSSRICERGTQSCTTVHSAARPQETPAAAVGWTTRFDNGKTYLTTHQFEADKWRQDGLPVWRAFARCDCTCVACSRGELHTSCCAVHNEPAMPKGDCDCGAIESALLAAPIERASIAADARVVQSRWKLAPISPTPEMVTAGAHCLIDRKRTQLTSLWVDDARAVYEAMIDAAPAAQDGVAPTTKTPEHVCGLLGYELDGVLADVEHGQGGDLDPVCIRTLQRVSARLHQLAAGVAPTPGGNDGQA